MGLIKDEIKKRQELLNRIVDRLKYANLRAKNIEFLTNRNNGSFGYPECWICGKTSEEGNDHRACINSDARVIMKYIKELEELL